MKILSAKGVGSAIAIGRLHFIGRAKFLQAVRHCDDPEAELKRLHDALELAKTELSELAERAQSSVGSEHAAIFEVQAMMLDDEDFRSELDSAIGERMCAESALESVGESFAARFEALGDEYMRERALDVRDICARVCSVLGGDGERTSSGSDAIICADELTPGELMKLDRSATAAIVTRHGSTKSHTAIIARTLKIPALIGVGDELSGDFEGLEAIVDCERGEMIIAPEHEQLASARLRLEEYRRHIERLESSRGKPTVTHSGRKIGLFANVGSLADIEAALENDAEGVGLFRSEFLFMDAKALPDEQTQCAIYSKAATMLSGKPLVIRTLDLGADKQAPALPLAHEENPALGLRAIRLCLTRLELFKTQLRAILRASAQGELRIMLPLIISPAEIIESRRLIDEIKSELRAENIKFDESIKLGIMIETPAAALISDRLAQECDFFSIGTNDLLQYTLAVDRQNESVDRFVDPHHPALLKLIELTVENAHKNGIECSICGELGADTSLCEYFLDLGVDKLSMSSGNLLEVKARIRELDAD